MSFLTQLQWRFATKKFDTTKKLSEKDLHTILEAIRLVPSSYGLQPYHIYVISNSELRKKLRVASFDQPQVTDSSHFLVFAALKDAVARVGDMVGALAKDSSEPKKLEMLRNSLQSSQAKKTPEEQLAWAKNQTYIALGFGLAAAAELAVDSCPMEGFKPSEYAEILELPENQVPTVVLALGHRKEAPTRDTFRFAKSELFTELS